MNLSGVCFDLDGVLVDTGEGHKVALNRALREVSGTNIPNDRYAKEFHDRTTKYKLNALAREGSIDWNDIDEITRRKNKYIVECIEQTIYPHPNVTQLLEYIKTDYKIPLVCVTNNQRQIAEISLEMADITHLFDHLLTSNDVVNPKPHPEIYHLATSILKANPYNLIAVEDNQNGLQSACGAGLTVWDVKSPQDLSVNAFETFLDNWQEAIYSARYGRD